MAHLRLSGCFDWWIFMDGTRLTYLTSYFCIQRTDVEAETPILWPPDAKSWLTGKDPGAGKDWGREEKGTTEDEMVGWHHRFNGHEFVMFDEFGSWWWTGRPGMLWFMGSQRVRHDWAIELNWRTICVFCLEMTHVQIILNYRLTHITPVLFSSSALVTGKKSWTS